MDQMPSTEQLRRRMVEEQIRRGGIRDERVLAAMLSVPRHRFVLPEAASQAYDDRPLPIGFGQTISQPFIVGLMTQLAQVGPGSRVLEIGSGSGYQAAVLGEIAASVHTIERHAALAERARQTLAELGYGNVTVITGDGSLGWPEAAPYDAILVTAAAPAALDALLGQLAPGGRLVAPVGGRSGQMLQLWQRTTEGFEQDDIIPVAFVPLRGAMGWSEDDWNSER